ncbi:membrane-bound alpha-1,6 mannosyltransferase initiation-specific [Scheffersomyces amazonensis]|uniref:membrane-bound alpha-1,6 mannosyltransferase initiation-specific n=1 Tax=Scheffersomyces amazonensis TaxID=1078765 RepID=UPI00315C4E13
MVKFTNNQKLRVGILAIVSVYIIYLFIASFSLPTAGHRSNINSGKFQLARELEKNANWAKSGLNFQPNKITHLPIDSTIRQQLSYQFPYEPHKPIPKNIWQTWKVSTDDKTFPQLFNQYQLSWEQNNPDYKHYVVPDELCDEMIKQLYATIPDVAHAYKIMPKNILKADFFRYLILYARGGVYSDIDTLSLKPIDIWVSHNKKLLDKPLNAGFVVGIEADPDRPDWAEWYARRIQFCQWTIQSKRGHPLLRELIAKITEMTLTRERNGELKKVLGKDAGGDIMNWTGPGSFTDSVFEYLNNILQSPDGTKEEIVTWKMFAGMQQPIAIDDVLVLPITSFSPDVDQMGARTSTDEMAYAKHMFSGSWKHDDGHKPAHFLPPNP